MSLVPTLAVNPNPSSVQVEAQAFRGSSRNEDVHEGKRVSFSPLGLLRIVYAKLGEEGPQERRGE